jgi:hypothetical protein
MNMSICSVPVLADECLTAPCHGRNKPWHVAFRLGLRSRSMKPRSPVKTGNSHLEGLHDTDDEIFEDSECHPEVPLSVAQSHRAYPEIGPHHMVEPQEQHQRRIDELRPTITDEPDLPRHATPYSSIDPTHPTSSIHVRVIGAIVAVALIALVALSGWFVSGSSTVGDASTTEKSAKQDRTQ